MNAHAKARPPVDDTRRLTMEMEASRVLIEQMRDLAAGDEDFLSDMVEGETGIFEIIAKIDASELDDQIAVTGLEAHIKALQERKRRAEARCELKRTLIAAALDQIGLKTHRTPLATITVAPKPPVAIVTEESDIPTRFWKAQPPALDKKALNEAIKARRAALDLASALEPSEERQAALEAADRSFPEIPGATLSNGGFKLTIRR